MASEQARNANRQNARSSTGPRTDVGKARASQNARKHGLTITRRDHSADDVNQRMTQCLMQQFGDDPSIFEAARAVTEAEIHVRRVFAVKQALMRDCTTISQELEMGVDGLALEAATLVLKDLEALERYERRAFSRRKSAIRHLEKLHVSLVERFK